MIEHLADAIVACRGDHLVGSAALETYADGALLRPVAVATSERGTGVGETE